MYQFEVYYLTLRGKTEKTIVTSTRCMISKEEAMDKIPDCKRVFQCKRI